MTTVTDYPPVQAAAPPRSRAFAAVAIGMCGLVELFVLVTRGRIEALLVEFELEVPVITEVAINWVLPTVLAAIILVAIAKEFIPGIGRVADACNGLVLLLGCVSLLVYVAGISVPLSILWTALS